MPEPVLRVRDHAGGWRPVRELDPARVQRRGGRVAPTRYVADRLIVRGLPDTEEDALLAAVRERAAARGLLVTAEELPLAPSRAGDNPLGPRPGMALRLEAPGVDGVADALDLLEDIAELAGDDLHRVSLDHVVTGHQKSTTFGVPAGRQPAAYVGSAPRRLLADGDEPWTTKSGVRRPVVAVVDTGIGRHPWFDGPTVVIRDATLDGAPLGTFPEEDGAADPEVGGRSGVRGDALDTYAGHGTFIAGVVHQVCPDAVILPVRVAGGDGATTEWDLARTMERLLEYHLRGVAGVPGHSPVDVVVLASGFYLERPEEDDDYDGVLRGRLRDLRSAGILVVLSAGNDGSTRPVFPAAWAPAVRRTVDGVVPVDPADLSAEHTPLLVVTAANPNGTLAEFSNDGPWVTAVRPGTSVLSSMPVTFDGAERSWTSGDGLRTTTDPDDFSSGFALWSGTSFAGPVLAGQLAASLVEQWSGQGAAEDISSRVRQAWNAVVSVEDLFVAAPASGA